MKLFGRLVLVLALLSGVVYAKKVKLFDISKYDLKKKDTNALETFKVGNIIVKTDLKYHEDNEMYYTGSRMYVYMDDFQGINFLIKQNTWTAYHAAGYGKITFSDDFSEVVSIGYEDSQVYLNGKEYEIGNRAILKITVNKDEIIIFNKKKEIGRLSTKHMGKIVSYEQRFGVKDGSNSGPERVYKFLIFGENKEIPKKEKKDAK